MQALVRTAQSVGHTPELLQAVESVNQRQKSRLVELIQQHYGGASALTNRCFALWGLSFKPNTNDMREAPSRVVMEALWSFGASVRAYDPQAHHEVTRLYPEQLANGQLHLADSKEAAAEGADALVICTEWRRFTAPNFDLLAKLLAEKVIFDGRNLYDPQRLMADGWTYYGIGRGHSVQAFGLN